MQTQQTPITVLAGQYAAAFYRDFIDDAYLYHNYQHVQDVVEAARRLGAMHDLAPEDLEMLELAAWFHDMGYREGPDGHEERGVLLARKFLEQYHYPEERLQQIDALIMATKRFAEPQNLLEEVIRDSDYSHLGSEQYWDRCSRIRQELLMTRRNFMPEEDWVQFELDFMLGHRFHTEVAKQLFEATKQKNIKQLRKYQQRIQPQEDEEVDKKKKKKKQKGNGGKEIDLGRGVETMFRTTYRMHISLSAIADNKANIMLSINAIVISIVISALTPRFQSDPSLILPTFILLGACLTALVFAILATRPNVTKGSFTREDIEQKRSNLLFFGNFYKMPVQDFHWGMMEMIRDSDFLYSSMTRDLYFLGKVLAQKYRLLRICYMVFMYGLILSVAAFAIVLVV